MEDETRDTAGWWVVFIGSPLLLIFGLLSAAVAGMAADVGYDMGDPGEYRLAALCMAIGGILTAAAIGLVASGSPRVRAWLVAAGVVLALALFRSAMYLREAAACCDYGVGAG